MSTFEKNEKDFDTSVSPLTVAADSLIHFADGNSELYRRADDEDGNTELAVARITDMCITEAAC